MKNLFYYKIVVSTRLGGETLEWKYWNGYTLQQHVRWKWYFKYRAALLRIKYPKSHIEESWGHYEPKEKKSQIKVLKGRITAKKRTLTKWKNKMDKYLKGMEEHNKTVIIPFNPNDDPNYKPALEKIGRLEYELEELLKEMEEKKAEQ